MKKFLTGLLIISIGFNIYFLYRKIKYIQREHEITKLHLYNKISYKEGYDYFLKQIKKSYPEINLNNRYLIVYRWDSLLYDEIYRNQMKALDSMATHFGKYTLEYIFVTEMEEGASKSFLKRNSDEYKNVKMLHEMDNFISGLYNINNLKLNKPNIIDLNPSNNKKEKEGEAGFNFKQHILYLIMDSKGKILYTNKNKFMIVKDTAFLTKLEFLLPDKTLKILN